MLRVVECCCCCCVCVVCASCTDNNAVCLHSIRSRAYFQNAPVCAVNLGRTVSARPSSLSSLSLFSFTCHFSLSCHVSHLSPFISPFFVSSFSSFSSGLEWHWHSQQQSPSIHPDTMRSVCHFHKSAASTKEKGATAITKLGSECAP